MSVIKFIDMEKFSKKLKEVSSTEIFIAKESFHPDGLFSEEVFGAVGTPERNKTFGYINLNTKVLHPAIIPTMKRICRNLYFALIRDGNFTLTDDGDLVADKNGSIQGITEVLKNLDKIKFRTGTPQRENLVAMINHYRKIGQLFISKMPVMPPTYRDIINDSQGNVNIDPINDLYNSIITLSLQLSTITSSGAVYDILTARMQEEVLEIYNYITSKISKKEGLIRHDILGKRVDYSARAVVTGAANEVASDEIGIPFSICTKIFEPFIMYQLLNAPNAPKEELAAELYKYNQMELSTSSLRNLFSGISKHNEIPPELEKIIKRAIVYCMKDKVVIAKRDPVLHSEGTLAFKPILVDGTVLRLNPLYCAGYNADFDGDQMALFTPLTREAIQEAKEKMMTVHSKDGMNHSVVSIEKDTLAGLYVLTKDPDISTSKYPLLKNEDQLTEFNIYDTVKYQGFKTTVGKIIFNKECLPSKYPFINSVINKKIFSKIKDHIYKKYNEKDFRHFCEKSLELGFKYYTIAPPTFALNDLEIPQSIYKLKEKLTGASSDEAQKIIDQMENELAKYLKNKKGGGLPLITGAGVQKGGYDQLRQVLVAKGLMSDIDGNVLDPIKSSYAEGLNSEEFFKVSPATRKGIVDRVLNTADTGYLSRQLIFACQSVEIDPRIKDCKTTRTLDIVAKPDIAKRLEGRYIVTNKGTHRLFNIKTDTNKLVKLRSPLYCRTKKICMTCYGQLALRNKSQYVGITAASIIGERGTQLIMRTFHTAGAVSIEKIDLIDIITNHMDDQERQLFIKNFTQDEKTIISKNDGVIIINKKDYLDPKHDIIYNKKDLQLAYGYMIIKIGSMKFDITLDYKTDVNINHGIENDNDIIMIPFKAKEQLFICHTESTDFTQSVKVIKSILSGNQAWKNSKHFLMKVFEHYVKLTESDADFVHFETLCCNLLRDKTNPRIAARLNNKKYDAIVVNIKDIPGLESWLSSLAFENINSSIENSLIYPRPDEPSVLEKVILGEL